MLKTFLEKLCNWLAGCICLFLLFILFFKLSWYFYSNTANSNKIDLETKCYNWGFSQVSAAHLPRAIVPSCKSSFKVIWNAQDSDHTNMVPKSNSNNWWFLLTKGIFHVSLSYAPVRLFLLSRADNAIWRDSEEKYSVSSSEWQFCHVLLPRFPLILDMYMRHLNWDQCQPDSVDNPCGERGILRGIRFT